MTTQTFKDSKYKLLRSNNWLIQTNQENELDKPKVAENIMLVDDLLRTSIKKVLKAISAQEKEDATLAFQTAVPIVDKMAGKRIIHKNKAARIKSRLARKIKLISA